MADTEEACSCALRLRELEATVQQLATRMTLVEDGMKAVEEMKSHLCRLERSVERALEVLLPRVDALLTGLEATGPLPPLPIGSSAVVPGATASGKAKASFLAKGSMEGGAAAVVSSPSSNGLEPRGGGASAAVSSSTSSSSSSTAAEREGEAGARAAAACGDVEALRAWVARGVRVSAVDPCSRDTLLHLAARSGSAPCVRLLLAHGAQLNSAAVNKCKETPLAVAAAAGHIEAVKALLFHQGASRAKQVKVALRVVGSAALVRELARLEPSCVRMKQGGGAGLQRAAAAGEAAVARALLDAGADANAVDRHGLAPLHLAARAGHAECVRVLLDKGAAPNAQDRDGRSALHVSAERGHVDCCAALMARGGDLRVADAQGAQALHLAARAGHDECVMALMAGGAPPWARDAQGTTAMEMATAHGHARVQKLFRDLQPTRA